MRSVHACIRQRVPSLAAIAVLGGGLTIAGCGGPDGPPSGIAPDVSAPEGMLEVTIPDMARTRDRISSSICGDLWELEAAAPARSEMQRELSNQRDEIGFDVVEMYQAVSWASLRLTNVKLDAVSQCRS